MKLQQKINKMILIKINQLLNLNYQYKMVLIDKLENIENDEPS